jgi:hypothetical protein
MTSGISADEEFVTEGDDDEDDSAGSILTRRSATSATAPRPAGTTDTIVAAISDLGRGWIRRGLRGREEGLESSGSSRAWATDEDVIKEDDDATSVEDVVELSRSRTTTGMS